MSFHFGWQQLIKQTNSSLSLSASLDTQDTLQGSIIVEWKNFCQEIPVQSGIDGHLLMHYHSPPMPSYAGRNADGLSFDFSRIQLPSPKIFLFIKGQANQQSNGGIDWWTSLKKKRACTYQENFGDCRLFFLLPNYYYYSYLFS